MKTKICIIFLFLISWNLAQASVTGSTYTDQDYVAIIEIHNDDIAGVKTITHRVELSEGYVVIQETIRPNNVSITDTPTTKCCKDTYEILHVPDGLLVDIYKFDLEEGHTEQIFVYPYLGF